ncbi:hypothetical protein J4425_00550 [Candidatus Woesearchaeota archaeon]|nr:hypothetical protein [uncultured archaeon]AQS34000.1 hypothetical protein [uncultured archaeon]MBS3150283.1 hypothetical protein [Candidatus Woesearchaeota archaeon]
MFDPFEKRTRKFLLWSLFFLFIIFLTFLFFHPKFYENENLESFQYENLTTEEIYNILLTKLKPGDLILNKPISYSERYFYQSNKESLLNNKIIFFIYYNLFELLINSMGEGDYWHVFIYTGNGNLNSLTINGVSLDVITKEFVSSNYFTVLRPNVNDGTKLKAVQRANDRYIDQDIHYSFKNGLIIVFFRGTGINIHPRMRENKLVCSSYAASLYSPINFNDRNFRHVTPIDLIDERITRIILIKNERGFYHEA